MLQKHTSGGTVVSEFAIATAQGVKVPDVIWTSPPRRADMEATGDPTTLAPELCVEVMNETNTDEEMKEKRRLYRDAGAEGGVVGADGRVRFFADEKIDQSARPGFSESCGRVARRE